MKKAIICGGRKFDETCYPNLKSQLIDLLKENKIEEEVCGMARGADMFGSSVAHEMGLKVSDFYADWSMTRHPFSEDPVVIKTSKNGYKYNALAGINRNRRMAEYVKDEGICIALPGGCGTINMLFQATENKIPCFVYDASVKGFVKLDSNGVDPSKLKQIETMLSNNLYS